MLDFPAAPIAPGADYAVVRSAIEFISTRWREQPSIETIADHVGLSVSGVRKRLRVLKQRTRSLEEA